MLAAVFVALSVVAGALASPVEVMNLREARMARRAAHLRRAPAQSPTPMTLVNPIRSTRTVCPTVNGLTFSNALYSYSGQAFLQCGYKDANAQSQSCSFDVNGSPLNPSGACGAAMAGNTPTSHIYRYTACQGPATDGEPFQSQYSYILSSGTSSSNVCAYAYSGGATTIQCYYNTANGQFQSSVLGMAPAGQLTCPGSQPVAATAAQELGAPYLT